MELGGFTGMIDDFDRFGCAVVTPGDVDGDGVTDLAVGACLDDDGGSNRGAVWILFMNPDGSVRNQQKISSGSGGFLGALGNFDNFGGSLASLGDLDGDGVGELAVGAELDDDGGTNRGAVWILFLDSTGLVKLEQKISQTAGGFGGTLVNGDRFGRAVTSLGDLDGDGVDDLAVGADLDDDGGANRGAVWILFMNPDGSVRTERKISGTQGGFTGVLDDDDNFGRSLSSLGDLDGDGVVDLAVGASQDDDGGSAAGAVWILMLQADGSVESHAKIGAGSGLALEPFDRFGTSLASPGDLDGDGLVDLAVGAVGDDDGGIGYGAAWMLFLDPLGGITGWSKISANDGGFTGALGPNDELGVSLAALQDLNGDGMLDLAAGAHGDDDGGRDRGAAWILFLESAPVAVENSPPTVACSGSGVYELGEESVVLGGTVSDLDGDDLQYAWSSPMALYAQGVLATLRGGAPVALPALELSTGMQGADLGPGAHVLSLVVDDGTNDPVGCEVEVQVVDTSAPTLHVWSDVDELWPPWHQMVDVVVHADTQDASGGPVVLSARVTSSDDFVIGRGRWSWILRLWRSIRDRWWGKRPDFTEPRIDQDTGTIHVQLRAERLGWRGERVYTIDVWATDAVRNQAHGAVQVVVPHSRGRR